MTTTCGLFIIPLICSEIDIILEAASDVKYRDYDVFDACLSAGDKVPLVREMLF